MPFEIGNFIHSFVQIPRAFHYVIIITSHGVNGSRPPGPLYPRNNTELHYMIYRITTLQYSTTVPDVNLIKRQWTAETEVRLSDVLPRGKPAAPCLTGDRAAVVPFISSAILSVNLVTSSAVSDAWLRSADVITSRRKSAFSCLTTLSSFSR